VNDSRPELGGSSSGLSVVVIDHHDLASEGADGLKRPLDYVFTAKGHDDSIDGTSVSTHSDEIESSSGGCKGGSLDTGSLPLGPAGA
jgi:hypothetical protein